MPVSGSKGYRSGVVTLPNRIRLREMDSRLGMYPTVTHTGDKDRKGNFNVTPFDDREVLVFSNSTQNVMYGSLSISGSTKSLQPYAGNNDPNEGLSGVGRIIAGISDNTRMTDYKELSSRKNDVESLSFFDDARINLQGSGSFYLTGTNSSVFPGYDSRLHDKTQITIDFSSNIAQDVGMYQPAGVNDPWTGNGSSAHYQRFMAYYNKDLKKWDPLGIGLSHTLQPGSNVHTPDDMIASASVGFGPIMQIASASSAGFANPVLYDDAFLNTYVRPVKTFGFPFAAKYHASSSNMIKMSDYINHPFILEKLVWEFDAKIEKQSTSNDSSAGESSKHNLLFSYNNGSGNESQTSYKSNVEVKIFTFFMCRQYKGESKSISMDYFAHNGFDHSDETTINNNKANIVLKTHDSISHDGTNYFSVTDNRELITYSQLTQFSTSSNAGTLTIQDFKNSALNRDSTVIFKRSSASSGHSITGSFKIEAPCRITPRTTKIISALEIGELDNFDGGVEFGPDSGAGANPSRLYFGDDLGGRSMGELETSSRALCNGQPSFAGSTTTTVASGQVTDDPTTVVVPKPESVDKVSPYILLPEDEIFLGFQYPIPFQYANAQVGANAKAFPRVTFDGPAKLTLYGSLVKNNKEFHDTLNQPLTSECVHTSIGYNESLCLDQYFVATRHEYNGSYLDNFATGSAGSGVKSLIGSGENVLSGSFQRFVKCNNVKDRYYDTMLPDIEEMFAADGFKMINGDSFGFDEKIKVGSITTEQSANQFIHEFWHMIYPFEGKYSEAKRRISQNIIMFQIGSVSTSTDQVENRSQFSFLGEDAQANINNFQKASIFAAFTFGDASRDMHIHKGGTSRLVRPSGFKYGIKNAKKETTCVIYRPDRYTGQYADIIQQQYDTRFFDERTNTISDSPVIIKYVLPDQENEVFIVLDESEITKNTFESSNVSLYATSSLPYFDDLISRNRTLNVNNGNRLVEI